MKSIPRFAKLIFSTLALIAPAALPLSAYADGNICNQPGISAEVRAANGCDSGAPAIEDVVIGILNGLVSAFTIVAVIYVIIGGVGYMTSNGDSSKVEKAKKTILYALIGLVVCVLAFAIVNFVIINVLG